MVSQSSEQISPTLNTIWASATTVAKAWRRMRSRLTSGGCSRRARVMNDGKVQYDHSRKQDVTGADRGGTEAGAAISSCGRCHPKGAMRVCRRDLSAFHAFTGCRDSPLRCSGQRDRDARARGRFQRGGAFTFAPENGGAKVTTALPPMRDRRYFFKSRRVQFLETYNAMNCRKFVLLGCVVACVFAASTATAQMRGHGNSMSRMGMRGALTPPSIARMPMHALRCQVRWDGCQCTAFPMMNSALGLRRFNRFQRWRL